MSCRILLLFLIIVLSVIYILAIGREKRSAVPVPPSEAGSLLRGSSILSSNPMNDSPGQGASTERTRAERELELRQFFNMPIMFFGKVVDENNRPIAGASTFYSVATLSFNGSPTLKGPRTDAGGRFTIDGERGADISVSVEHPDYYKTESSSQKIEYSQRDYVASQRPPSPPTRNSPAIFVLRKKGISERLVHHREIRVRLPFDGRSVALNLRSGKEEAGDDAIVISLQSDGNKLPLNTFYPFDWSVNVEIPEGGVIERGDSLDFQAPASGYIPRVEVKMPAKLPRGEWRSWVKKDWFVSLKSGNYARLRLDIAADKGRGMAEILLNPTPGSRNLEFDPNSEW